MLPSRRGSRGRLNNNRNRSSQGNSPDRLRVNRVSGRGSSRAKVKAAVK